MTVVFWQLCGLGGLVCCTPDTGAHAGQSEAVEVRTRSRRGCACVAMATPQQETERLQGRGAATPPRAAGTTGSRLGR
jgi:hypothetical protein